LSRNYVSLPVYCIDAAWAIPRITTAQSRKSFDSWRLAGDICCLFVAFSSAPPAALALILTVAFAALLWRDGYIHPAEPTGPEAITDGLVVSTCILISQLVLLAGFAPLSAPARSLLPGLAIAVAVISGWRFVFRMRKSPRPAALESGQSALRLNRLWILAFLFLAATNAEIAPTRDAQEAFFQLAPALLFCIDYRRRSKAIGGVMGTEASHSWRADPDKDDMQANLNGLFLGKWSYLEALAFVALAFPICSAIAKVLAGAIPITNVDWMQLSSNAASFVALTAIWIEIKRVNERAGLAMEAEIHKRDAS